MNNSITDSLNNKRILIFGYGREGKSTENYIKAHCKVKSLDIFEGKPDEIDESKYDLIIKSPGIVMLADNPKYTSQTELFLNEFAGQTIGITGTKGKSTTSAMLAHTIEYCGRKSLLLGNIGKPCFDMIDEIDEAAVIVFELSCHQLVHIGKAPHISVFLNLFEEHLDYYKTMENYFNAKANIISHQPAGDFALIGSNVPEINSEADKIVIDKPHMDYSLKVLGEHNKLNAEYVFYIAAKLLGLDEKTVIAGIEDFKGLPHRLEYFGTYGGIKLYDDSISTIPKASISAVLCVPDVKVLIIGGMDRGIDYSELVEFIWKREDVFFILCYETGERIAKALEERDNFVADAGDNADIKHTNYSQVEKSDDVVRMHTNYSNVEILDDVRIMHANYRYVENLDDAVRLAKKIAKTGEAVVLSPAAPSYGYFKDFEARGECFKDLCRKIM